MKRYSDRAISRTFLLSTTLLSLCLPFAAMTRVRAQSADEPQFTLQADVQETGPYPAFVTARGNVLFRYPAQQIEATAKEAQYFREERKLVLMGNVRLNQRGEVIRDTQVICLLDVGQCMPLSNRIIK